MEAYVLKKKNKNKQIVDMPNKDKGYILRPNIKNANLIQISSLFLFDEKLIEILITKQYEKSFRRLAAITYSVVNDEDSTSADAIIALDEVARQKSKLIRQDKKYLQKQEEERLLKRFKLIENELKAKLVVLKNEEEKSFTR